MFLAYAQAFYASQDLPLGVLTSKAYVGGEGVALVASGGCVAASACEQLVKTFFEYMVLFLKLSCTHIMFTVVTRGNAVFSAINPQVRFIFDHLRRCKSPFAAIAMPLAHGGVTRVD